MKFLSLADIMGSSQNSPAMALDQSVVIQNGYTINNKAKPGKISLRYTTPKVKQSLSLQNVTNPDVRIGPSYIYTTSNDVVWSQQSVDSVGLNYLGANLGANDNKFTINSSDLLDVFHTFALNNDGYAVIEDEIVSFVYKEYVISKNSNPNISITVSVKNDLELASQINRFIKDKEVGLIENIGIVSNATSATATKNGKPTYATTYTVSSTPTSDVLAPLTSFNVGDLVSVTNMSPSSLNINGEVIAATTNSFTVITGQNVSIDSGWTGGRVTKGFDYDIQVTPTGNITNINRGMFGTNVAEHKIVDSNISNNVITSKDLAVNMLTTDTFNFASPTGHYSVVTTKPGLINPAIPDPYYYVTASTPANSMLLYYPNTTNDEGYKTYSSKFNFDSSTNTCSGGIFFNLNNSSSNNSYYVELVRYNLGGSYDYYVVVSQILSGTLKILAWTNVTGTALGIVQNFEKLYYKTPANKITKADGSDAYTLYTDPHEAFNLRFTYYPYNYADDGEGSPTNPTGNVFSVFLNNIEISGWQIPSGSNWVGTSKNTITGLNQKVIFNPGDTTGTKFGAFLSANPTSVPGVANPTNNDPDSEEIGYLREIYATTKSLRERSVNYYFQDREFLNGLVQNERLYANYKEYMMQTHPTVIGINVYDVQYTNGSAVSVDVLPVEYAWFYYPGNTLLEQQFLQHQIVDEYSVSYSTPINTGFRGKFALVNNSSHMVYLKKDSDELNAFVVNLNLWTHEIIVPSDPQVLEYITNSGNIGEVVQIDSAFIQSEAAANKLLKLVGASLDNFAKDISVTIFGNPLIEVGDIISLTYPLMGINNQKMVVHSVNNTYNNGIVTKLVLNIVNRGVNH
jgi:hypothetical protein